MLYLVFGASILAFTAYLWLLGHEPATRADDQAGHPRRLVQRATGTNGSISRYARPRAARCPIRSAS